MANLDDALGTEAEWVGRLGAMVGVLADLSGAVGFLQLVGLVEGASLSDATFQAAMTRMQRELHQVFLDLKGQIAAGQLLDKMNDIDNGVNDAVRVMQELIPDITGTPPPSHEYVRLQIDTCINAVNYLYPEEKWRFVAADIPYYSSGWSGVYAPAAAGDGTVFWHPYTLPQCLRAITILLTAVYAYDRSTLAQASGALKAIADRLQWVHDTIATGIRGSKVPTRNEFGSIVVRGGLRDYYSPWYDFGVYQYEYGAVEVYSGRNNVWPYIPYLTGKLSFDFKNNPADAVSASNLSKLIQLRILGQQKVLYEELGMAVVRRVIDQLRALTGQLPAGTRPYEAWSTDEVFNALALPISATEAANEQTLAAYLGTTTEYAPFLAFPPAADPLTDPGSVIQVGARPIPNGTVLDVVRKIVTPREGTLFRDPSGAVWVVYGGAKFHVPDVATYGRFFPNLNPYELKAGAIANIADTPFDGTLLREDFGAVWVVYGGAKFHVPDIAIYGRFFPNANPNELWAGALSNIPDIPIDGSLLREDSGAIWVVYGAAKFHIPDVATYGRFFPNANPYELWAGALANIPDIPIDGSLLREDSGATWVVYGGGKFHVPDIATYGRFFPNTNPFELWAGALANIPDIPIDGTLFREESSSQTYIIQGGYKARTMPSANAHILWDGALNRIPDTPAATPTINVDGTVGPLAVTVDITDITPGVSIYYTLDGSDPSRSSTPYAGQFAITFQFPGDTVTVKACAVAVGFTDSAIAAMDVSSP